MKKKSSNLLQLRKMKERKKFLNFNQKNISGQSQIEDLRIFLNYSMAVKDSIQ
jgi:hypothetical protein